MLAATLADLVVILHLLFIGFVLLGGLLVLCKPWIAWIHIPMMLWASLVNSINWPCPLTPLENYLRQSAGQSAYTSGFIEHYLLPLLYPPGMSYLTGVLLGVALFVWNIVVYSMVIYRYRQRRKAL